MPRTRAILVGLLGAWFAGGLVAQRVWVVRVTAPVQPVVDAASPGDRIEVYGGIHPGFSVGKALDIVGMDSEARVESITATGLPTGGVLSIRGLEVTHWGIVLRDNRGTVVLRRLLCRSFVGSSELRSSDRVHVESCFFYGGSSLGSGGGISVERSNLTMVGSVAIGSTGRYGAIQGIWARQADMMLSRCRVIGGNSLRWWDARCPCWRFGPAAKGIGDDGRLILLDRCEVAGGSRGAANAHDMPDVLQTTDTVLVGAVRQAVTIPLQPVLDVPENVARGGALVATVCTDPLVAAVVFADIATPGPTSLSGFPVPFYLTSGAHVAGVRITDPQGIATFTVRIPNDPRLRFRTVFLQAAAGSLSPHRLGASAPRSAHIE